MQQRPRTDAKVHRAGPYSCCAKCRMLATQLRKKKREGKGGRCEQFQWQKKLRKLELQPDNRWWKKYIIDEPGNLATVKEAWEVSEEEIEDRKKMIEELIKKETKASEKDSKYTKKSREPPAKKKRTGSR